MIICDTREKKNQHILNYFNRKGIPYKIETLHTADYMDDSNPSIVIDRKQNLDEIATNLCTKDDGRFWREIRRSMQEKVKLIVLCEHGGFIKNLDDIPFWRSRYSRITGSLLQKKILQVHISYGVEFFFCSKSETGQRIVEIITNDFRQD